MSLAVKAIYHRYGDGRAEQCTKGPQTLDGGVCAATAEQCVPTPASTAAGIDCATGYTVGGVLQPSETCDTKCKLVAATCPADCRVKRAIPPVPAAVKARDVRVHTVCCAIHV